MRDFLKLDISSSNTFSFFLSCSVYFSGEFYRLFFSLPLFNINRLVTFTLDFIITPVWSLILEGCKVCLRRPSQGSFIRVHVDWLFAPGFLHKCSVRPFCSPPTSDYCSLSFCGSFSQPHFITISSFSSSFWQLHLLHNSKIVRCSTDFWIFDIRHLTEGILVGVPWNHVFSLMTNDVGYFFMHFFANFM